MDSSASADRLRLRADSFAVWGWSMADTMWPIVRDNFAVFHNWDHEMQRTRKRFGLVSLTPVVSRTRHIGIKGVNFQISEQDPVVQRWLSLYIPENRTDFADQVPHIDSLDFKESE
jgi:hypothetical protein